eukprot:SAG11_NODE_15102_length_589_cov_0.775510_2_plen_98_part_00
MALPDDGFFMDNDWSEKSGWAAKQRWAFAAQNSTAGVPQSCLRHYAGPGEQWRCFMAQWTAPFIETPLFALQPMVRCMPAAASTRAWLLCLLTVCNL